MPSADEIRGRSASGVGRAWRLGEVDSVIMDQLEPCRHSDDRASRHRYLFSGILDIAAGTGEPGLTHCSPAPRMRCADRLGGRDARYLFDERTLRNHQSSRRRWCC